MYDVRRLEDNRNMVGSASFAGPLLPMLAYGLSLVSNVRKAMSDFANMRPVDRLRYFSASFKLNAHDGRLFRNDVIVNTVATHLAIAMETHGIPKIAAAFRAALALIEHQNWKEIYEEVEHARRANDG